MSEKKDEIGNKVFKVPHTFVLIFFIIIFCALITYVVPTGQYTSIVEKTYTLADGTEKTREILDPSSFEITKDEFGNPNKYKTPLFGTDDVGGKIGVLNAVFEGMVSGNKYGSAVGVMMFILVVGGSFGILMKTGAIDNGLISLIAVIQGKEVLVIPVIFFIFSLGGAVFGMGEEVIPFIMILVPLTVALGYDSIVAIMISLVATQIGFATSWMNPFGVAIAQGISDIPVMSNALFRIVMWLFFTAVGIVYTILYSNKIKKSPKTSVAYDSDEFFRHSNKKLDINNKLKLGDVLVLLTLLFTMIWIIWGVVAKEYYIPEIAAQFFVMGVVSGIIGVVFKMNDMEVDDIAKSFQSGAGDLIGAALVVGMAKGIIIVMGGIDPSVPSVLNTILHNAGNLIGSLPGFVSAWFMYLFQSVFNFFIVSGSGQAAISMPIMAPLSDIVGIPREVAVIAYQLGDGFTNLIVPTSGVLIACLGAARIEFWKWFKFQYKFQLLLFGLGSGFVIFAAIIGLTA